MYYHWLGGNCCDFDFSRLWKTLSGATVITKTLQFLSTLGPTFHLVRSQGAPAEGNILNTYPLLCLLPFAKMGVGYREG